MRKIVSANLWYSPTTGKWYSCVLVEVEIESMTFTNREIQTLYKRVKKEHQNMDEAALYVRENYEGVGG
jgi:hypothetical protein